jgi:hypothetical protein
MLSRPWYQKSCLNRHGGRRDNPDAIKSGAVAVDVEALRITLSVLAALMTIPLMPPDRIQPIVPLQAMLIDSLMVRVPKPPGSRQLILPAAAVFEIAPANVLQGAVRLHGLASSPTPETQVRVAWALAGSDSASANPTVTLTIS